MDPLPPQPTGVGEAGRQSKGGRHLPLRPPLPSLLWEAAGRGAAPRLAQPALRGLSGAVAHGGSGDLSVHQQ